MDWSYIINQVSGLLIGGMVFVVFVGGIIFLQRFKNEKAVTGKILVVFWGPAGLDFVLCRIEGSKVEPPEAHYIKGSYLIKADSVYPARYPVGYPRLLQVGVPATSYIDNEDEPIVSKYPDAWLAHPERSKISAAMRHTAMNESQMKIAMAMSAGVWKDLAAMAQYIKSVPLQFKLIIGIIVINLIMAYLIYMVYASVMSIRAAYG
jgi:hypothetical protein